MSEFKTWRQQLSLDAIKEVAKLSDSDYDLELKTYLNGLIDLASFYSNISFDDSDEVKEEVFLKTVVPNKYFVNLGQVLNIGAWRQIDKIEKRNLNCEGVVELEERNHIAIKTFSMPPFPKYQIQPLYCPFTTFDEVTVTGVKGFSEVVPSAILDIFAILVKKYAQYLENGAVFVSSEKSVSLARSINNNDVLESSKIFAPAQLPMFMDLFKRKYNVIKIHPLY